MYEIQMDWDPSDQTEPAVTGEQAPNGEHQAMQVDRNAIIILKKLIESCQICGRT